MRNSISIICSITIIFSIIIGLFIFQPKDAKAIFGIGDVSIDPVQLIKELVSDGLIKPIARQAVVRLQQEIARWAQGGFSDENKPFAMTSWKQEVQTALNIASSKFVQEFNLTPLCSPIRISLGTALGLNYPAGMTAYNQYANYAACTLGQAVDNLEDFYKNPSIAVYGWDTWTALTQPNNNFLGSALMALEEKARIEEEEIAEKEKEVEFGGGYKNDAICTQDDLDACKEHCPDDAAKVLGSPPDTSLRNYYCKLTGQKTESCVLDQATIIEWCEGEKCQKSTSGICVNEQVKKLGSEIKESVSTAIGSDMDWLISADEITDMIGLVFSGLFNKLINGIGLSLKTTYNSGQQASKNSLDYTYYAQFKKNQTSEDLQRLRTDILSSILTAVKNISSKTYECDDHDDQFKGEAVWEIAAEILDQESQHYYTGAEGVNLKPDYIVLDPPGLPDTATYMDGIALVENMPIKLYGSTWDEIPYNKYPSACQKLSDIKCSDIKINLPFKLDLNNANYPSTSGPQVQGPTQVITGAVSCNYRNCLANLNKEITTCNQKLSQCKSDCDTQSGEFGIDPNRCKTNCSFVFDTCRSTALNSSACEGRINAQFCLDVQQLIGTTNNSCNSCFTQAQEKCEIKKTAEEKTKCIKSYCGGEEYADINSRYNEVKKRAVSPPAFTNITSANDFYGRCRAVKTKYNCDVCLKEYFMPSHYCEVINDFINRAFTKYPALVYSWNWIGMYNKTTDCKNDTDGARIQAGLTCRIFPDFIFPDKSTCKTRCNVTEEELKNIADDQPQDLDCSPYEWTAGGYPASTQYINYLVEKRASCCILSGGGDMSLISFKRYTECRGISGPTLQTCTYATPVQEEPQCYCGEGYRPLGFTRTGNPSRGNGTAMGGDCGDFSFTAPPGREVYGETNASPVKGDMAYFGSASCKEGTTADVDNIIDLEPSSTTWKSDGTTSKAKYTFTGAGETIHAGVYITGTNKGRNPEKSTGWHICAKCDSSDTGYPYYGTGYDQCNGKI